jgi:hypothetical protein
MCGRRAASSIACRSLCAPRFDDILRNRDFSTDLIIRVLKNEGYAITRNRMNYHDQQGHHRLAAVPKEGKVDPARRARVHLN